MRTTAFTIALCIGALMMGACGSDDDTPTTPPGGGDDPPTPAINDVNPPDVTAGTVVTLTGQHFGSTGQLFVNDAEVTATSWSDTTIVFTVPAGLTGTEIEVRVASGGQDSAIFSVPYAEPGSGPVITSVDPATVTEGTIVLVYGESFGTSGELRVNGDAVATVDWTDTLIQFIVPTGLYGTQLDLVVESGGQSSPSFPVPFVEATVRQLTFDGLDAHWPCWSADGSHIYFTADGPSGTTAFYAVPFDGGDITLLYDGPGNDRFLDVCYYQAGSVLWISDETTLGNADGDWEVWKGSGGFNPRGYVDADYIHNDTDERAPAWNHSIQLGVPYAWTQDRPSGGSMIYVEYNNAIEPLVSGFQPRFCAYDGDRLAYLTPAPDTGYDIMTISVVPGSVGELLYRDHLTAHNGLDWGHNGQIAYILGGSTIWIMDDDGTNHRKLTDSTAWEGHPRFSPDGAWVSYISLVNTGFEVFVARVP